MTQYFDWNIGKVKTVKLENGQQIIHEMSPKDIIAAPNRHRMESIVQALCISVNQLIRLQEVSTLGTTTELPKAAPDELHAPTQS